MIKSIEINNIVKKLIEIGELVNVIGDTANCIEGFSSIFNYKTGTITFLAEERSLENSIQHQNDCYRLMITAEHVPYTDAFQCQICVKNTRHAFFSVLDAFFGNADQDRVTMISSDEGVFRAHSLISPLAIIGRNVKIGAGCVIEGDVQIGDDTEIHHNVVIRRNTKIGKRCTIFSGAVIGERGFNYTLDAVGMPIMIEHYGGVTIEDDVHIGDHCCIVQGVIDDTVIKCGAKINTMVHIAHNSVVGRNTRITSPAHICGSVNIGDNCHIAASIIRNQVTVGEGAILGLGAVVVKDVEPRTTVIGVPAKPIVREQK